MPIFEIQGSDGKVYEVEAPDMQSAARAMQSFTMPPQGSTADSQALSELGGKARAALRGLDQGLTFGLVDEGSGLLGAALGQVPVENGRDRLFDYSGTFGDRYRANRDAVRMDHEQAKTENPLAYGATDVAGSTALGVLAIPATGGSGILGNMGRGALAGGIEGGLHGAGRSDGGDLLADTLWGAGVGSGIGLAAPAAVGAAGAGRRALMDPATGVVDALTNRANTGKANRAIAKLMQESNQSPDDVAAAIAKAAREGQPEYRLMDATGVAGQRQASGIARSGGKPGADIAEFLEQRQLGQGERVGAFVEDAFGVKGTTAQKTGTALKEARTETANKAYGAARGNAAPVDVRGAISAIDDRIGGMQGSGVKGDSIDGKLAGYRARLVGDGAGLGDDVSKAELSDFDRVLSLKQSIQDDIGTAVSQGRNNEARELGKIVAELDKALEASSDMYRSANDGFREASRVIDALDEGAFMAKRGRAADNVSQFQDMTPDQQNAARVGYGDHMLDQLERATAPTSNRAKPMQSAKRTAEAEAMSVDPRLYADRLARENDMWLTQNRALGGSRTADNIADQEAIEGLAGGAIGALRNSHGLIDMSVKLADTLAPYAKGQNEATRALIAKILMSDDPSKALADALRQDMVSKSRNGVVEALLRNSGREPAIESVR